MTQVAPWDKLPCTKVILHTTSEKTLRLIKWIEPTTIPLHSLGVIDVAGTGVEENEILSHALSNISRPEKAEGWAVRRSGDFVNEFARRNPDGSLCEGSSDNPNHLLGSFPCLFPYGQGGYEVDRALPCHDTTDRGWTRLESIVG